jgi:anti-sigma regulatory factor (Ser/Thr protein kinase)
MGKKFSDQDTTPETHRTPSGSRDALVFIVSSDRDFVQSVLTQCSDIPEKYVLFDTIDALMAELATESKVNLVFVLIVEHSGAQIDIPLLRVCKLDYPQVNYVILLEECDLPSSLRLQSLGVQNVLLPPFSNVSLRDEIATALPNIQQFKRHPDLMKRGFVRLDFLIPNDLSYVLGVNHFTSLLLKEFSFPPTDCRINIPLALDEALTNAIVHGNRSHPEKKVSIQMYVSASRIKIRIKDQGDGFDVAKVADPRDKENILRPSGRGVYLMKQIMDNVTYKEGGRVVEMEKANTSTGNGVHVNNKRS